MIHEHPTPAEGRGERARRQSYIGQIKRSRVVFVEDDPNDQDLLQRAADEVARFEPRFMCDGDEVLAYLGSCSGDARSPLPDLIVLDLNMPCLDGRATLRRIRSRTEWAAIPVVILTSSSSELDSRQCSRSGANAFVRKPESFEAVCELLEAFDRTWLQTPPRRPG